MFVLRNLGYLDWEWLQSFAVVEFGRNDFIGEIFLPVQQPQQSGGHRCREALRGDVAGRDSSGGDPAEDAPLAGCQFELSGNPDSGSLRLGQKTDRTEFMRTDDRVRRFRSALENPAEQSASGLDSAV